MIKYYFYKKKYLKSLNYALKEKNQLYYLIIKNYLELKDYQKFIDYHILYFKKINEKYFERFNKICLNLKEYEKLFKFYFKKLKYNKNIEDKKNITENEIYVYTLLIFDKLDIKGEDVKKIKYCTEFSKLEIIKNVTMKYLDKFKKIISKELTYEINRILSAYKMGNYIEECHICCEENKLSVELFCKHEICINCFNKIDESDILSCPFCRDPFFEKI